uniref:Reverse transcriptase domain-containing protein n=1 Tax=Ananas comosus var. bracteatus TaxID=296719 RepID=A0A6V7NYK6_ANACO|nr:unnamed protein product [Ananas comosus var. bracteatus]
MFCHSFAASEFAPDMIIISAGFDAARGDPLGCCDLICFNFLGFRLKQQAGFDVRISRMFSWRLFTPLFLSFLTFGIQLNFYCIDFFFRFLSWNVRGLNDPSKCTVIKSFIRNAKCCVVCLQETKISSISPTKFHTICGFHLQDFRALDAVGTKGGLLTAWNPSLFECLEDWGGSFSLNVVLKRKRDGSVFMLSNIYGPTCASLKAAFFRELRYLGQRSRGVWAAMGDFNALLSLHDKNGPLLSTNDILQFREVVSDLGLVDLPLRNKSYTWTNGRRNPTLECLDRTFISQDWLLSFPNSFLSALPRPRSDHTPLLLSAHTFVPSARIFRFESFWLQHPALSGVISQAWNSSVPSSDPLNRFASKIECVQNALKSWSSGLTSVIKEQTATCLRWLGWLDRAEEDRALTISECMLRPLLKVRYEELCLQEEIRWRQRSRIHWLRAGDANTKFFHLHANRRKIKNSLSQLADGSTTFSSPEDLAKHLFHFFHNTLGVEQTSCAAVNLSSLYDTDSVDLSSLSLLFTVDEVKSAIFSCAPDKAPGPDGFPMLFYQRFWTILKDDIMDVFDSFYNGSSDLTRLNISWICPISKKKDVTSARDLRPISLVHSMPKLISKVLATRLQRFMNLLINPFQAAFVKGRYILDNFLSAHILVHHLHSSNQQAALFKIDFERAFDNINWHFLTELLQTRGFGQRWINWISCLLHSSTTAVLVNGAAGLPFTCKRGLRQGDPLSPLLFILCTDVLFQMLHFASSAHFLPSIGIGDAKLHTLQFADDMLLFFDGSTRLAAVIKLILDAFSATSGLKINFQKSAIIPISLHGNQASSLACFFGCSTHGFPFKYLGLPLSPKKLHKADYLPLIEKLDNRLAGWKGLTLSRAGRLALLNSVLSSIPTFFCTAFRLPSWVINSIDKI